jgi:hypothetical protein
VLSCDFSASLNYLNPTDDVSFFREDAEPSVFNRVYERRSFPEERPVKKLIAAALVVAFVTPALAAEFYVVQNVKTKKCTVVDKRPTSTETTVVGDGKVYTTREEAMTGMKSVKVCTSN